jgi:FkbM family methyltransferase
MLRRWHDPSPVLRFKAFRDINDASVHASGRQNGHLEEGDCLDIVPFLQKTHTYYLAQRTRDRLLLRKRVGFYSQFVGKGDLCFDVGANLGNRTEVFLRLGARVVAVEPQEECVKYLEKRFGGNSAVVLVKKALGAQGGTMPLAVCTHIGASSMSKEWMDKVSRSGRLAKSVRWEKNVDVQVTTLDTLIATYGLPTFCKIDVEGFEYEVLKGLSRPIRGLSFELTPEVIETTLDVVRYLGRVGSYEFNFSSGDSMGMAASPWQSPGEIANSLTSLSKRGVFGDVYARLLASELTR